MTVYRVKIRVAKVKSAHRIHEKPALVFPLMTSMVDFQLKSKEKCLLR